MGETGKSFLVLQLLVPAPQHRDRVNAPSDMHGGDATGDCPSL